KQRTSDRRIRIVQALIIFWLLAIGAKLVYLQVGAHDGLRARAENQHQFEIDLSPTRGVIFDRNGNELARSAEVKSLYASPSDIKDPETVAARLSSVLEIDREALLKRLTSKLVLVAVKRKLTPEEITRVDALAIPGLRYVNEMKRFYVSGATASHVLGFVDVDERGMSGIELTYDKLIRGQGGRLLLNVDALKNSYDHELEESVPGANITLTIDTLIQHYAERALADAVRALNARGGTIVILRPATGEILALANAPNFDPNKITGTTDIQRRNRAIETAFEPGSIFKIVPYAAALEEKLVRPDSLIDCGGGEIKIAGRVVHDRPYGTLTATQALAKSSNVAAIKIGQRLGNDRLARYIEEFGFGRRTGIELPAESSGLFRPASKWAPTTIGSIPMGHEIGVTAVQAVASFAAVANGGAYLQPHLVARVTAPSGEVIEEHKSEPRRIISEATASTLKAMLESVVVQGTGKKAQIGGYRAAGKTGTAQKVDEASGRYSNTKYVASFAGFAPIDNPEIACIVSIDEPRGAYHGGDAAAPVFARVVADALHILGVPPEDDPRSNLVAGDFRVYDLPSSVTDSYVASMSENTDARPSLDVAQSAASQESAPREYASVVVPDLTGRGIRDAIALCAERGLKIKASGEGVVSSQSPPPGTLITQDTVCHVKLSNKILKKEKPEAARAIAQAASR
ncbi:MAG TPA: penicillin-binding protein, partial [Blastocatellia bacterium]|nr:penicillin-binding protein [Blastocatellia bacterium]